MKQVCSCHPGWALVGAAQPAYARCMDADRRELHALVDALPDEAVALLMADLHRRLPAGVAQRRWPSAFFGMGADRDGRSDLSECVEETLASGFGAPRP